METKNVVVDGDYESKKLVGIVVEGNKRGGGVFVLKKATLLLERIHINNINTNVYVVETRMEWGAVILFLATILANTGIQASSYLNQFAVFVPAGKF